MPSCCAVPNCTTNKVKNANNRSVFRLPRDENLRSKWIMSIPRVESLRSDERICEKHFEKHLIVKEYIKYDDSGKIIAQVPLARTYLKKDAVPTIFDHYDHCCMLGPYKEKVITDHTYASLATAVSHPASKIETETACINTLNNPDINDNDPSLEDTSTKYKLQDRDLLCDIKNDVKCISNLERTSAKSKTVLRSGSQTKCLFTSTTSNNNVNVNTLFKNDIANRSTQMSNMNLINDALKPEFLTMNNKTQEDTNMFKHYECAWTNVVFDSISFSLKSLSDSNVRDNVRIKLPKPWNANKLTNGLEDVLLLTCIVRINEHDIQKHVLEKTVMINTSREIVYEVYSTPVDVSGTNLPKVLKVVSVLPEILKKFNDFRTCKGIVAVDLNYIQDKTDLKRDIYSNLRHKNCSILSVSRKRCTACRKYSEVLFQKIRRLKKRIGVQRICTSVKT